MSLLNIPAELTLESLFSRYLREQTEAHTQGLGQPGSLGDAVPHDLTPMQPVDPRLAWDDARAVASVDTEVPGDWGNLVNQAEPAIALAFALGNYPQMVRHVAALLMTDPASLEEKGSPGPERPGLVEWAQKQEDDAARLLAAGVLRVARLFETAEGLFEKPVCPELEAVRQNERAALLWHRGDRKAALAIWEQLPESVPVIFNRGMGRLFSGDAAGATQWLARAQEELPENSAWHHLAGLYLAMASGAM